MILPVLFQPYQSKKPLAGACYKMFIGSVTFYKQQQLASYLHQSNNADFTFMCISCVAAVIRQLHPLPAITHQLLSVCSACASNPLLVF
jgi:hypothetical protein